MASDKKKVLSKKHIDPSDAIKKHLMEQPSKKKPEYLVRGALLHCRCGSYAPVSYTHLTLPTIRLV